MKQNKMKMEMNIVKKVEIQYLLYLPVDYENGNKKKWPLVLFLHGAGESGFDLEQLKVNGIPGLIERGENFPFIAVSPQCPPYSWWGAELETLDALLDDIIASYNIDTCRVYITGLSMGGFGTWYMITEYPERFAAAIPICGGGLPEMASIIRNIPIWVFHGEKDDIVPLEESQTMVNALKECGVNVKFTIYPEAGHDSWTETYNNPELYKWMLSKSKTCFI